MNASASNIANLTTEGSLEEGGQAPYSALTTVSKSLGNTPGGVRTDVVAKNPPYVPAYSPDSPFADEQGIVGVPNVSLEEEIVNLKLSEITYKANIATIKASENLSDELLSLFDDKV
ncbi:MAG: flagellar biosynthesis protein FlgC [Rhodospirillales bacterium]|nr:flagellar biosynthesis protein FlgC [Alphaproteobacteria bacterium]MCB1838754.1 flagellar biosynthesis protein FlgC [Alphaproteobacteria bacterium]MCB9977033.1 flagellar biosynthesis protein FlgC [Rhodospirillales bacterium]